MNASGTSDTHDSARGLFRGRRSRLLSTSHAELSAEEAFPFLDASASRSVKPALFFPHSGRGKLLSSYSSSSLSSSIAE